MKVDPHAALAALGAQLSRGGALVSFADDGELGARLTLGQIIKGRVLRSYEGGRHLVDFSGQQRVVDSAVPLRPDEVFHGRVIGLGEQVQLQKLAPEAAPPSASVPSQWAPSAGDTMAALFERYRAQAPAPQLEAAAALVARLPQPQTAALAALVLAKLGLPLEPAWIRALHARLAGTERAHLQSESLQLQTAATAGASASLHDAAIPALAGALAGALLGAMPGGLINAPSRSPSGALQGTTSDTLPDAQPGAVPGAPSGVMSDAPALGGRHQWADERLPRDQAQRILNLQTRGSVAHRLGTLPLLVDGRLVELEVALFDEGHGEPDDPANATDASMRHRQIVIALETSSLGRVEVRSRIVGTRMQVSLATTASESTLALSLHSASLNDALQAQGWEVDGLSYLTQQPTQQTPAPGGPLHSVVEHIINPGSVSRLV